MINTSMSPCVILLYDACDVFAVQVTICRRSFVATLNTWTLSRSLTDRWRTTSARSRKGKQPRPKVCRILQFKRRKKIFLTAISILLTTNHCSFRVLFEKIASVYFIWEMYLYLSTGNGRPREPALCQLYRHTFVPYWVVLRFTGIIDESCVYGTGLTVCIRSLRMMVGENSNGTDITNVKKLILK